MPKYKYGVPNRETDLKDFKKKLENAHLALCYKAYLVLLFWLGVRRSEPLFIVKEDIEELEECLYIAITCDPTIPYSRLKEGKAAGPARLPLKLYGVEDIKTVWQQTPEGKHLFNFCSKTGYRKFQELFPKRSPHWLRHNRLTKLRKKRDKGKLTTDEIKAFTGIKRDATIENYGLKTARGIHRVSENLE